MDSQMIQQLYEAYGKELFLYLYSLCRNRELSQDLLQETYVKAILSLPPQHGNMRAWLYLTARNLCLNIMKRENRKASLKNPVEPAWEDTVLEQFIQKEQYRELYRALSQLSFLKREVLQLQYFSGLPLKEIAGILQVSPENARVLSHRAKRELRAFMEEKGYGIS